MYQREEAPTQSEKKKRAPQQDAALPVHQQYGSAQPVGTCIWIANYKQCRENGSWCSRLVQLHCAPAVSLA